MVKHALACSLVLLMLVCALNVVAGASIKQREAREQSIDKAHDLPASRQASDVDGSSEDSDEDDEGSEDDLVLQQGQNSYAAQQAGESIEDSDEDDGDGDEDAGDDDGLIRRRRDADAPVEKPKPAEETNEKEEAVEQQATESENAVDKLPETTIAPTTTTAPTRKSSVLVQIRDALKKVTTGLPTEQVANNALQYFQLFEHFIQQTIEQYIGDDDDEEEEAVPATTIATPEDIEATAAEVPSSAEKEGGIKAPEASSTSSASVENAAKPDSVGEKPATETVAPAVMQEVAPTEATNNAV